MLQNWETLTFLHWRFDPSAVQKLIPPALEVETFDGSAWVGLVPFVITQLRPSKLPALPWISKFPETNVRTYVRGPDGESGVWFFTLEAARCPAVVAARAAFGLPYRWARMRVEKSGAEVRYMSRRYPGLKPARSDLRVSVGHSVPSGDLEHFLTARWRLYALRYGKIVRAEIDHEPWPLQSVQVLELDESLMEACGFQPRGVPVAHYAEIVHARIGGPKIVAR